MNKRGLVYMDNPMWNLCDYLLSWITHMCENAEGKISPEVYDRAVSVIGTGVPLLLLVAALGAFLVVLGRLWSGVRK